MAAPAGALIDHHQHRGLLLPEAPRETSPCLERKTIGEINQGVLGFAFVDHHLIGVEVQRRLHGADHGQRFGTEALALAHNHLGQLTHRQLPHPVAEQHHRQQGQPLKQHQRSLHRQQPSGSRRAGQPQADARRHGETRSGTQNQATGQKFARQGRHFGIVDQRHPGAGGPAARSQHTGKTDRADPAPGLQAMEPARGRQQRQGDQQAGRRSRGQPVTGKFGRRRCEQHQHSQQPATGEQLKAAVSLAGSALAPDRVNALREGEQQQRCEGQGSDQQDGSKEPPGLEMAVHH